MTRAFVHASFGDVLVPDQYTFTGIFTFRKGLF
jgi:hypothetical protein